MYLVKIGTFWVFPSVPGFRRCGIPTAGRVLGVSLKRPFVFWTNLMPKTAKAVFGGSLFFRRTRPVLYYSFVTEVNHSWHKKFSL